jgi:hypothetical protein
MLYVKKQPCLYLLVLSYPFSLPLCHSMSPAYLMQVFLSRSLRFIPLGFVLFSLCTVLICPPRLSTRILQVSLIVQILFNIVEIFRLSLMLTGHKLAHSVGLVEFLEGVMNGTDCFVAQCTVSYI